MEDHLGVFLYVGYNVDGAKGNGNDLGNWKWIPLRNVFIFRIAHVQMNVKLKVYNHSKIHDV